MKRLWKKNFKKDDTSVLSQEKNWKPLLDPSSLPPSPLFPNWENQGNTAQCMTSPTRANLPQIRFHLSIPPSAHTISHAHGELFPQSVSSFIDCRPDPKPPSETLRRLIEPSQYTTINGQVWLYASAKMTASQPTHATTSASPQQAESMDSSQTPEQTSSEQTEWVRYQSGLTTTYFSGSVDATLTHTTASDVHGAKPSPSMGGEYTKEVAYGTRATPCLMDAQKSLMKTWPLPCETSPAPQHTLQMTLFTHMPTTTLTTSQKSWAYLGKSPRASPSDPWFLTSVSVGTLTHAPWQSQQRKSSNISMRLRNGRKNLRMHWQRYKGYTVSYFTSPWSSLLGAHTSPTWKPCFQASIIVLSCHTPHPATHLMTLNGGQSSFVPLPSQETSLAQFPLWTSTLSQTQAPVSASAWRLLPGWKANGQDIGWAEAVGFELLTLFVLSSSGGGTHFKVYGDNKGVVEGWWKGRSRNKQMNTVFRCIHSTLEAQRCTIHTRYVPSKDNPADQPSRGIYPHPAYLLPNLPIPTEIHDLITDFDSKLPSASPSQRTMPNTLPEPHHELSEDERASVNAELDRRGEEFFSCSSHN